MRTIIISCIISLATSARAADNRPPPDAAAPVLQLTAGTVLGGVGAVGGAFSGMAMQNCVEDPDIEFDLCGLAGFIIGGGVGYSVGNILGVSLVGKWQYGKGYWAATTLGNILGTAAAVFLVGQWSSNSHLDDGSPFLVYAALIPLLTTASYHAGRHWDVRAGLRPDGLSLRIQKGF
jgi:hypothetical protein